MEDKKTTISGGLDFTGADDIIYSIKTSWQDYLVLVVGTLTDLDFVFISNSDSPYCSTYYYFS